MKHWLKMSKRQLIIITQLENTYTKPKAKNTLEIRTLDIKTMSTVNLQI